MFFQWDAKAEAKPKAGGKSKAGAKSKAKKEKGQYDFRPYQPKPTAAEGTKIPAVAERANIPAAAEGANIPAAAERANIPAAAERADIPAAAERAYTPAVAAMNVKPNVDERPIVSSVAARNSAFISIINKKAAESAVVQRLATPTVAERLAILAAAERANIPAAAERAAKPAAAERAAKSAAAERAAKSAAAERAAKPAAAEWTVIPPVAERAAKPAAAEWTVIPPVAERAAKPPVAERVAKPAAAGTDRGLFKIKKAAATHHNPLSQLFAYIDQDDVTNFRRLLDQDSSLRVRVVRTGLRAADYAAFHGKIEFLDALKERGFDLSSPNGITFATVMHYAALAGRRGTMDYLSELCDIAYNIETADVHKTKPIHYAALGGHQELVKYLATDREICTMGQNCHYDEVNAAGQDLGYFAVMGNHKQLVLFLNDFDDVNGIPEDQHLNLTKVYPEKRNLLDVALAVGHRELADTLYKLTLNQVHPTAGPKLNRGPTNFKVALALLGIKLSHNGLTLAPHVEAEDERGEIDEAVAKLSSLADEEMGDSTIDQAVRDLSLSENEEMGNSDDQAVQELKFLAIPRI